MSTNIKTISLLTILALSAVVLTACSSHAKEPSGFAPKTAQSSKSPSSTSSSAKTPSSSKVTASEKTTASSSQEQADASSSQTPSSSIPQSNQSSVAETSQSSTALSQETAQTASTTTLREQSVVKPLPPGVAAGTWAGFGTINDDGTMVNSETNSDVIIWRVEPQTQGVIYMGAGIPGNGGFYVHYYPAGVKIPFDNFEDPTDISKDRLIAGDGGYLNLSRDHIDDMLTPNVHYRQ